MGKPKLYDVKVNISMAQNMADWLDALVATGKFGSRSHVIRRCVQLVQEHPEVKAEL